MCTVALAHRVYPGAPLLLAANRDEARERPSTPWRIDGDVLAPRDERAGGTWLGVHRSGVAVAVTNRFGVPRDGARRSRGLVVVDALRAADVDAALRAAAAIDPASVNPFHLLVADGTRAGLVVHDGERIELRMLEPGWTVVTERSYGAASTEREARVRRALEQHATRPSDDALRALLSVHTAPAADDAVERVAATCVHIDELGYGTRSSSLLTLGETWAEARLLHAEGPPCVTPYADLSPLLRRWGEAA